MEAGQTLDSINEMLSIYNQQKVETLKHADLLEKEIFHKREPTLRILSSLHEKYNLMLHNVSNLFKDEETKKVDECLEYFKKKSSITKDCTLPQTNKTNSILSRIEELREEMNQE
jgi:hypothetical protein